ncbi:hypothetical protein [Bacteroides nordii]
MNNNNKIIYVRGSIKYTSVRFRYAPYSGAHYDESYASMADEIIDGDLFIGPSSKNQGSIYTTYWAKGSFSCTEYWDEFIPISMEYVRTVFDKEIASLNDLLLISNKNIDCHILFRMILVDIFSAFDYYLSQVLLCKYAQNEEIFQKYCKLFSKDSNLKSEYLKEDKFRDKIRVEIFSSRIDKLNDIFQETLGVNYPQYTKKLKDYIELRHLCVHRLGIKKSGERISLNEDIIRDISKEVSCQVDKIHSILAVDTTENEW